MPRRPGQLRGLHNEVPAWAPPARFFVLTLQCPELMGTQTILSHDSMMGRSFSRWDDSCLPAAKYLPLAPQRHHSCWWQWRIVGRMVQLGCTRVQGVRSIQWWSNCYCLSLLLALRQVHYLCHPHWRWGFLGSTEQVFQNPCPCAHSHMQSLQTGKRFLWAFVNLFVFSHVWGWLH